MIESNYVEGTRSIGKVFPRDVFIAVTKEKSLEQGDPVMSFGLCGTVSKTMGLMIWLFR